MKDVIGIVTWMARDMTIVFSKSGRAMIEKDRLIPTVKLGSWLRFDAKIMQPPRRHYTHIVIDYEVLADNVLKTKI